MPAVGTRSFAAGLRRVAAFRRFFREGEIELRSAATALQGMELVSRSRPDAIVLDLNLPDLPGLETIAHQAARQFGAVFGEEMVEIRSLEVLRDHGIAPQMPEDTPLQVPPEIERLAGKPERPVRA